MNYISKTTRVFRDYEGERKRESTLSHLARGWVPADPLIFDQLRESASDGTEELIEKLKLDLGLCGKVIGQLKPLEESREGAVSPFQDLKKMSGGEILNLIPSAIGKISRHRTEVASGHLKQLLNCGVKSSHASEIFALRAMQRGIEVAMDSVAGSSVLRQLGYNLLAWNYPSLFFKLIKSSDIEASLEKTFGFSIQSLAYTLGKNWKFTGTILNSFSENPLLPEVKEIKALCDLGDSFGKRSLPKIFPLAVREWQTQKEINAELIGSQSDSELEAHFEDQLESKLSFLREKAPQVYNLAFSQLRPSTPATYFTAASRYKELPENVIEAYDSIYNRLEQGGSEYEALLGLTKSALPVSGFAKGLINIDQSTIRFGLNQNDSIQLKSFQNTAIECKESPLPVLKVELLPDGKKSVRVSGSFSTPSHEGVLVLELPEERLTTQDNLLHFKAARDCLVRCLS